MEKRPEEIRLEYRFDPEKYRSLAKSEGLKQALTQLHHDINLLELESVEGEGGFKRELFEELRKYREFSHSLWTEFYDPAVTPRPSHIR